MVGSLSPDGVVARDDAGSAYLQMVQGQVVGTLSLVPAPVRGFRPAALRAAREAAGLSQGELAARIGAPLHDVYRWERGLVAPTPARLLTLARSVGVEAAALAVYPDVPPLAWLRIAAGLTQRELGPRVGVSHATISRLERGLVELREEVAAALASVLAVPVDEVRAAHENGRAGGFQP